VLLPSSPRTAIARIAPHLCEQLGRVYDTARGTVRRSVSTPTVGLPFSGVRRDIERRTAREIAGEIPRTFSTIRRGPMGLRRSQHTPHLFSLRDAWRPSYAIGPATDVEDWPPGFGARSHQERILETELHRFVRMHWDVVVALEGAQELA
jgi:hypothetical protein